MKSAFVTGSAGFVGSHLIPKLAKAGYSVLGVDPATKSQYQWKQDFRTLPLKGQFDVVVHLAANILDVDARSKGGVQMYEDIELDLAMCKYIEAHPPREAFIAMSSCAVDYPEDPYSWVKKTLEQFCHKLYSRDVPAVILRPFSGYGGDQKLSYPFPAILQRAVNKENPLTVWGGEQIRDWIHIEDLTDAIMYGIKRFPRGIPIDIGTGEGTNFFDLAAKMAEAVGYNPEVKGDKTKATSSPRRVADTSLAKSFGWEAKIPLADGIKRELDLVLGEHRPFGNPCVR